MHRVRSRIFGTAQRPRLSIFRSNRYTYVQLINDAEGKTLATASSLDEKTKNRRTDGAARIGKAIGEKASRLDIKQAVVDRGGYRYHGRVKAVVEAARAAGLKI